MHLLKEKSYLKSQLSMCLCKQTIVWKLIVVQYATCTRLSVECGHLKPPVQMHWNRLFFSGDKYLHVHVFSMRDVGSVKELVYFYFFVEKTY